MFAGILKYCNSVYLSGSRVVRSAFMHALQMSVCTRSEQRKGNPLRKYTIKDTFRCLITIWSIGIAKRGLNELIIFEKPQIRLKSTFFTIIIFFFLPVTLAQNSPCAFTLILPAWVPYNIIKSRRSTKLPSFNDVQNAMPQKIRSACLHDSRTGTYPIYIRFISTYE